jgi:parvulin-like peptidyl-prolyl isomerase
MRSFIAALLSALMLVTACSRSGKYPKDSKQYAFFTKLSTVIPSLNPAKKVELLKTTKFTVYSTDVMPALYRNLSPYETTIQNIPKEQLTAFVFRQINAEGEKRLMEIAAADEKITVPKDSVDSTIQKIFKNMGGKEQFLKQLASDGMTLDEFEAEVKSNRIIQKYIESVLFKNINVSSEEILSYYNQERFATVRHILMMTQGKSDSAKAAVRRKMEEVHARAKKGEDFAKLAKQYSEDPGSKNKGGLYEKFERGAMVPSFDALAFSLPIGALSDVFETPYGFHFMKIVSRSKETRPMDKVREGIVKELMKQKQQAAYEDLMKSLKLKYQYKELVTAS